MKSAFKKPSNPSESGESDSETDTKVSTVASMASACAMTKKPKSVGFFRKPNDSDSDSESEDEVVSDSKSTSSKKLVSKSSGTAAIDPSCTVTSTVSSDVENSDSDFDSDSDSDSETKKDKVSESESKQTSDAILSKTRKALKNQQRIKEAKKKQMKTPEKSPDMAVSSVFDSFQNQQNMMSNFDNTINIRCCQRNSRKSITTIEDINPIFFENSEKVAKLLGDLRRSSGTRATHKIDKETSANIIEISGKKVEPMIQAICKHVNITEDKIHVHGLY